MIIYCSLETRRLNETHWEQVFVGDTVAVKVEEAVNVAVTVEEAAERGKATTGKVGMMTHRTKQRVGLAPSK